VILNHAQLVVADVAASRAFYARWFGLTEAVHDEAGFVMLRDSAGGLLALHEGTPEPRCADTVHLGFLVRSAEDVVAFRDRARAEGLREAAFDRSGGFAYARVRDPDGHAVEVYALPDTGRE
jgi:catechol 2,3-dioxygenase-like lactoylglutathione lyase family enzyme